MSRRERVPDPEPVSTARRIPGDPSSLGGSYALDDETIKSIAFVEAERRSARLALPLVDFVPHAFPGFVPPRHLAPFAQLLEAAEAGQPQRALVSVAVQHGKTSCLQAWIARMIARDPLKRIAYASYSAAPAHLRSKQIRDIAQRFGAQLRSDVAAGSLWMTTAGGAVHSGGIEGAFTGYGFDVVVFDDPYSERRDAESALYREQVETAIKSTLLPRVAPGGSLFIVHARWHPEDAIGVRLDDPAWSRLNLSAICEDAEGDPLGRKEGEALWPEKKQPEFFEEARRSPYDWASLYQGQPRPRGGAVFEEPRYYEALPAEHPAMYAVGFDLAYSAQKQSDWSVLVVLALVRDVFYVVEVRRWQAPITAGRQIIAQVCADYPGATRWGWIGGQEAGIVALLNEPARDGTPGVGLSAAAASGRGDKFVRAQPVAADWNSGRVLLPRAPRDPGAVEAFARVVRAFTGTGGDRTDDDVDALAAAHHVLRPYVGRGSMLDGVPRLRVWRQ